MINESTFRPELRSLEPTIEQLVANCVAMLAIHISSHNQTDNVLAAQVLSFKIQNGLTINSFPRKTRKKSREILNLLSHASGIDITEKDKLLEFWRAFEVATIAQSER